MLQRRHQGLSLNAKRDNALPETVHRPNSQQCSVPEVYNPLKSNSAIKDTISDLQLNTRYDLLELSDNENVASSIQYFPLSIAPTAPIIDNSDKRFPIVRRGIPSTEAKENKKNVFLEWILNPANIPSYCAYWYNDDFIVIYDRYPKSQIHLLLLPRMRLEGLKDLTLENRGIEIVQGLESLAKSLISQRLSVDFPDLTFNMGFHAIPSMKQVHMHLISDDFSRGDMLTCKSFNGFTTGFFLTPERACEYIKERGSLQFSKKEEAEYNAKRMGQLKCPLCGKRFKYTTSRDFKSLYRWKSHMRMHYNMKSRSRPKKHP